ncbi:MAG: Yop proteins translocation protein L [Chlamydiae bacterium]|nr:Yop proteins translocation protein L [Chlamydiota bacterium]
MNLFTLIEKDLEFKFNQKIIPQKDYAELLSIKELLEKTKVEIDKFKEKTKEKAEVLKENAKNEGFQEGLLKWASQLERLETEIKNVRKEFEQQMVDLVVTCAKKIVGQELMSNKKTIISLVKTSLKPVAMHKYVHIYCNREDLTILEKSKPSIKEVLEHCEKLSIEVRKDIERGGCIIETEAGIINAQLDVLFENLKLALSQYLKK